MDTITITSNVLYECDTDLHLGGAWNSTAATWSGRRYLVESTSDDMSSAVGTSDVVDTVQRSLSTGLPVWCSYVADPLSVSHDTP